MAPVTWKYLAGDTDLFAVEFSLVRDQTDDSMVDPDERTSWGSIAIWIGGRNLCEHYVQGERLASAHWYLLPICEWFAENWDQLLHEERFPIRTQANTAEQSALRASALAEVDASNGKFDTAELYQDWAFGHRLRASAPGALLPDLYIRRYGDKIELSTGRAPIPGENWGIAFSTVPTQRLPVEAVARPLLDAISSLAQELQRRTIGPSERVEKLGRALDEIHSPERTSSRMAWLSGAGSDIASFLALATQVREAIPPAVRDAFDAIRQPADAGSSYLNNSPISLLFGSLAPTVAPNDIGQIINALVAASPRKTLSDELHRLGIAVLEEEDRYGVGPGELGGMCGEEIWRNLTTGETSTRRWVDVESIVVNLGVPILDATLSDRSTRAISYLTREGAVGIVLNRNFRSGSSGAVRRFTLAHELAHLILDQDRASEMLVASGPWAPNEVEQRANGFAAAFLMPTALLDEQLGRVADDWRSVEVLATVARTLRVSLSALISRLQNLGRLSPEDGDLLRDAVTSDRR